jgi:CubicO group peptidase (beta-lactamase class C family)
LEGGLGVYRTLATAFLASFFALPAAFADENAWPTASPEEAGFSADLGSKIDAALQDESFGAVHSIIVVRDGKLVYERYLAGDDQKLGWRIINVTFNPDMKHDVRSITKSVVGLLYGIALGEGSVPALDAPLVDSFPEYADLAADPERRKITIGDALIMSLGVEWDEDAEGDANSEGQMERVADIARFALERPIVAEPGTTWVYNGGATSLLARVVARGTGMTVTDFARDRLFGPLGITDFEWVTDYHGVEWANAGLRLRPRDLAKIGQLVLDGGRWTGAQVVPEEWIAASTRPSIEAGDQGCDYGYQWWLCKLGEGVDVIEGSGRGGQEVVILPKHNLVFAATGGDYSNPDAWEAPWRILEEVVLPSLR